MSAPADAASTLRWIATALALAVVFVVTLLVIGEAYGGTDVRLGVTVDGEPGVEQLVGDDTGTDVRNASVALGLIGLGVAIATYFYWRHTGHQARRRHRRERLAADPPSTTAASPAAAVRFDHG